MDKNFDIDKMISAMDAFSVLLNTSSQEWDEIYTEIGNCDKETSDLIHEMELTEFDHVEGYLIANEMKKLRLRRRTLKDYQDVLASVRDVVIKNRKLPGEIAKTTQDMKKKRELQSGRKYFPRIRKDTKLAANNLPVEGEEMICPYDYELDMQVLNIED